MLPAGVDEAYPQQVCLLLLVWSEMLIFCTRIGHSTTKNRLQKIHTQTTIGSSDLYYTISIVSDVPGA